MQEQGFAGSGAGGAGRAGQVLVYVK
jgi:hypothetical protein